MILVIKKVFDSMELLSKRQKMSLKEICEATGLNKGTLCNILKTLVELGYVKKLAESLYALDEKFHSLASHGINRSGLRSLAEKYASELSFSTKESGLVSVLSDGKVVLMAKSVFDRSVIINTDIFNALPLYTSASGKVLLAFMGKEHDSLLKKCSKDGVDLASLKKELSEIRNSGICIQNIAGREAYAMAAPVFGANGKIIAAMGICVPSVRLKGARRLAISEKLRELSKNMSAEMVVLGQ
jgi:DNA-binding IclR family transcriptional regulator